MRGTKLEAWRIPPAWNELDNNLQTVPENSAVPAKQKRLQQATRDVLTAIAADVRGGLLETVGVESRFTTDDGRCAMILELPASADAEQVARAIDLENVEAWRDAEGKVRVGISPWLSTKDVDQTVLCAIKVVHVLLGLHAGVGAEPKTFKQKLLTAIADVMKAQKSAGKG
ncbi:MAG TPA: hypothetical protein VF692_00350 [Pyrinomonadaceae bacterium]